MEETIRALKLDIVAQTAILRARWTAAELQIMTSDGADVGWMQSSIEHHVLYLEQIFIDAAFQRRGIGTAVILGLIDQATLAGKSVTLGVVKTSPARGFTSGWDFASPMKMTASSTCGATPLQQTEHEPAADNEQIASERDFQGAL